MTGTLYMIEGVPETEMHCVMPCNVWCIIGAGNAICTVHRSRQAIPLMASPQNVPMITGSIHGPWDPDGPILSWLLRTFPSPTFSLPSPYHRTLFLSIPSIPYLTYPISILSFSSPFLLSYPFFILPSPNVIPGCCPLSAHRPSLTGPPPNFFTA